ncbi:hypothetical protein [Yeosuana marina]|jgi:DNA-binding phage protein|uniref:hypothetical protein n=1 Tax=Yeosuana marina TaxID=1565536 RepID=UPI0030C8019A|tara:strand:- start:1975 stop:2229 length:255 start_codon:yes stop_codon:yes gene_type:complete
MKAWREAYSKRLGENLLKLIKEHKTDVQTVASIGDIESKQVYRVINAENEPKVATLIPIAKGLGVHVKVLYDFEFDIEEYKRGS